jgi:hypothetical protein
VDGADAIQRTESLLIMAQRNDMLFQFQGSDVVAVVRVKGQHQLKIGRRAVLTNDTYIEEPKLRLPLTSGNRKPIEMYIDMRTP